jgi:hypothetical protein
MQRNFFIYILDFNWYKPNKLIILIPKWIFFFNMFTQEKQIRTSNFHFIRCGLQPIELLIKDQSFST